MLAADIFISVWLCYYVRYWSVFVRFHLAILAPPYDKDDDADKRNETEKEPPSALAYVVKTTYYQSKIW